MKSIVSRSSPFVAALLFLLTFSGPSRAELVLTLVPTASTDLSNVQLGDTLQFLTIGSSSEVGAGEHLTVFPLVHLFSEADFDVSSGVGVAGWSNLLDTHPTLTLWTV